MVTVNNLYNLIRVMVQERDSLEQVTDDLNEILSSEEISLIYQAIHLKDQHLLKQYLSDFLLNGSLSNPERYKKLCLAAMNRDGLAIRYVEEVYIDDENFYLTSVKQNGLALEYVPKSIKSYSKICYAAITENPHSVQYVTRSLLREEKKKLYLLAVGLDGLVLEYIFEAQDDIEVCSAAVEQNIFALEFVDETIRTDMCKSKKREEYLERNYMSHVYFAAEYKAQALNFLGKIFHVIVFNKEDLHDKEIDDVQLVYSRAQSRRGTVTCVATSELNQLMNDFKTIRGPRAKIHLIVLGHANVRVERIAGLSDKDITKIIQENPCINKVTLFGCKSAQALQLEEERRIIQMAQAQTEAPCGLVLVKANDMRTADKLLSACKLTKAFVIVEYLDKKLSYSLRYIEKKETGDIVEEAHALNDDQVLALQNQFNKKKPLQSGFAKNTTMSVFKSSKQPLSFYEVKLLQSICSKDPFNRLNPSYKSTKRLYPFLKGIVISEAEAFDKLKPSLLQKLIEAIKLNDNITWEVSVKGYSNIIHVDKKLGGFHVVPGMCYSHNYYKNRLFALPIDNIDRKKLSQEIEKMIEEMKSGTQTSDTITKSIEVKLRPK